MENILRTFTFGAVLAGFYALSGIVIALMVGLEPAYITAIAFSVIGVAAAWYGWKKQDLVWWSAGILVTGFLTPTVFGLIPMIISLLIVLTACWFTWQQIKERRGSE